MVTGHDYEINGYPCFILSCVPDMMFSIIDGPILSIDVLRKSRLGWEAGNAGSVRLSSCS